MCIICVSKAGVKQPSLDTLRQMFNSNPHGAGYMVARNNSVEISKGFMTWADFEHAINYEKFTDADSVVYHFRISTQAGVKPSMTHPFPLTRNIEKTKMLDVSCPVGVAHNGIISLTSDPRDKEYSDTAHYIAEFLCCLVRNRRDMENPIVLSAIERTTKSKWAIMDSTGYVATVGNFIEDDGLLYSNGGYRIPKFSPSATPRNYKLIRSFFDDDEIDY